MSDQLRQLREEAGALVAGLPGAVRKVSLRTGTCAVEIEWLPAAALAGTAAGVAAPNPAAPQRAIAEPAPPDQGVVEPAVTAAGRYLVRAPVVGTCYLAARPGAAPFVRVGDVVERGQTLCIIEAMKLMNEVVAGAAGRVVEILAGDAEPVEYDQPLVALTVDASEAA
jgi:acetyl-CoA carboxylase biotin carboxyl carrier protein